MLRLHFILFIAFLFCALTSWGEGRVARFKQGIFLYSNWDVPVMTLDSCLETSVTQIEIPDSITVNGRTYPVVEIGPGAFSGCQNLKIVYYNHSIDRMLKGTFRNCPNLRVLVLPSSVPLLMEDSHPFYGGKFNDIFEPYHAQSVIVVVPPGSEETYRNTPGWKEFQTIQTTMPTAEQLDNGIIEIRIRQLENELEQARRQVQRLENEINALKHPTP